jgi:nucleoside-diphosphate-sugar epimerase
MHVFIAGGTGYIGLNVSKKLIASGHQVSSIALPPLHEDLDIPKAMHITLGNYMEMDDESLNKLFSGIDVFIFAAGVDERLAFKNPKESYQKYNIDPLEKLLKKAKTMGVKKTLVLGSYFSYFAKKWSYLNLEKKHPYIESRIKQEQIALSYSDEQMIVSVFELPYIFGVEPGRKPVWSMFIDLFEKPKIIFFPKGGTTMMTINQVGTSIKNWCEKSDRSELIPMGYYQKTWKEMIKIMLTAMGQPRKHVITLPNFLIQIGLNKRAKHDKKEGIISGLNPHYLLELLSKNAYIDKSFMINLGVGDDDIDQAIYDSISYALKIKKQAREVLDMKAF